MLAFAAPSPPFAKKNQKNVKCETNTFLEYRNKLMKVQDLENKGPVSQTDFSLNLD